MYSFKIIQNWSRDLYHSSILNFEKKSYLFNCSDGTQRNAMDQGIKFTKISNIFYNSSHIDGYLGTFGFWMSRNEQLTGQLMAHEESMKNNKKQKIEEDDLNFEKMKQMRLWGPPGFSRNFKHVKNFFFEGVKNFVGDYKFENKFFSFNMEEKIEFFEDENVKIYPICTIGEENNSNIEGMEDKNKYAMSYICEPHLKKPVFLVEKAKALGLKPGPKYAQLQKGESVFLENGIEIKPSDVLGKVAPSSCIGIFYSPSINHALNLTQQEIVKNFQQKSEFRIFSLAVHIISDFTILEKEFYQNFISLFGEDTIHIIDCPQLNFKFMLNEGKHKMKTILNKVNSYLFRNDYFTENDTLPKKKLFDVLNSEFITKNKIINSSPGFEYNLYPIDKMKVAKEKIYFDPFINNNDEIIKFQKEIDEVILKLKNEDKWKDLTKTSKNIEDNFENFYNYETQPEITFLGTTSMKPGKYRNVSSILVRLSDNFNNNSILLDCGEGSFQQILDHYGNKITDEILSKLKLIFITHKHGDHMLGVLKVLFEIDKLKLSCGLNPNDPPNSDNVIYLIAPKTVIKWINQSIINDLIYKNHIIIIDNSWINPNMKSVYQNFVSKRKPLQTFQDIELINDKNTLLEKINDYHNHDNFLSNETLTNFYNFINKNLGINFYTVEVFHCDESYGCFLEEINTGSQSNKKPWKISYSGDTRPCNNFFNFSFDSSVFIHEATFEDELQKDAEDKMHSTFAEGIQIGKNNKSWRIILTHFSPRYLKFINWKKNFNTDKILLSHDFLTCKISDLDFAYKYTKNFSLIMEELETNEKYFDIFK